MNKLGLLMTGLIPESFSRCHPFDTMASYLDAMSKHYIEVRVVYLSRRYLCLCYSVLSVVSHGGVFDQ